MATNQDGVFVSESNLDSLDNVVSTDRNISQMAYAVNINAVNVYDFMDHSYSGSAGYRDGSYLIPFSRESSYTSRKQLAHYKNYLKPILRAMVEPCFTEQAPRTIKDASGKDMTGTYFEAFLKDCDGMGTSIQDFSKQAVAVARRHGVSFTVMDNYPSTAQPLTVSEALRSRIYPYIYLKKANEVEDYTTDQFGNLIDIMFTDSPIKTVSGGKVTYEKRWRKWTTTESIVYAKNKNGGWEEISRASHNLGLVPVIMLFSDQREEKCKILPDPPLYDIAKLNYVIFNQCAEIRDQERAQAFSIFYCQGVAPNDLVISNNTYINLPDTATISPGYASPDFNIIKGLVENQEQNRKDLFALAEQNGVVGVQTQTSGVALSYDFYAHSSVLKQSSNMAIALEQSIARLFMIYTKESFVYTVQYPSDFAPMGLDNEITRYLNILKTPGINPALAAKITERITRLVLRDEDPTEIQRVIDEINGVEEASVEAPTSTGETGIIGGSTEETPTEGDQNVSE